MESLTLRPRCRLQTALQRFCEGMPHLTKLSLSRAHSKSKDVSDGVLRAISGNMHHLKYLDISHCTFEPKAIEYLLPTEDNALGGCPELIYLDLTGIESVCVGLLKKIILALPKLKFLKHGLLVDALSYLTEEEMGEDTARSLNNLQGTISEFLLSYYILAKSPAFQRFKNNITTVDIFQKVKVVGHTNSRLLANVLKLLPNLRNITCKISEADKHVLPLLESIGDRVKYLHLLILSGDLSVHDVMRTCRNLVELSLTYSCMSGRNIHHDQVKWTSKLPVLMDLTKIQLRNLHKGVCSAKMLIALLQSPWLQNVFLFQLEAMSDDVMFNVLSSGCCTALSKVTKFSVHRYPVIDGPLITETPFVNWLNRKNCSLQDICFNKCQISNETLQAAADKYPKALRILNL